MHMPKTNIRDIDIWYDWINSHSFIGERLKVAERNNPPVYFPVLHASTEAMFRQILLVGLRLNRVTYKQAQEWLHLHDQTPDKVEYPKRFDRLYAIRSVAWATLISQHPRLEIALGLWHEFSKIIRNHLAHGMRSYSEDWLESGIQTDQYLLVELDLAMASVVGGSIAKPLTGLMPRLPVGKTGHNIAKLTGVKQKQPRPRLSLTTTQKQLEVLGSRP